MAAASQRGRDGYGSVGPVFGTAGGINGPPSQWASAGERTALNARPNDTDHQDEIAFKALAEGISEEIGRVNEATDRLESMVQRSEARERSGSALELSRSGVGAAVPANAGGRQRAEAERLAKKSLKALNSLARRIVSLDEQFVVEGHSQRKLRRIRVQRTARNFKDAVTRFTNANRARMFAERRNVMQAREELAATRDAIFSAEGGQSDVLLGAAGFTEDDLANEEAVIEDREREISQIAKEIPDLLRLYNEVAAAIDIQDGNLQNIDVDIEAAASHVESGIALLEDAREAEVASRRRCLFWLALFVVVVGGVVVGYFALRKK